MKRGSDQGFFFHIFEIEILIFFPPRNTKTSRIYTSKKNPKIPEFSFGRKTTKFDPRKHWHLVCIGGD